MARFHGKVGFLISSDNQDTGIATPEAVERTFYGRVIEHIRRWESADKINDDLSVSNQIAIVANDWAFKYASSIAYVKWMSGYWKVTSMRVKHPELILTLGGVWNGPTA